MNNTEISESFERGIDFSKAVELPSGVKVINGTPHPVVFINEGQDIVVLPSGANLSAKPSEIVVDKKGEASIVETLFEPSDEGLKEIAEIESHDSELLVVGSVISAQAYPGKVFGMSPAAGFERVPVEQKRMDPNKFIVFPTQDKANMTPESS